MNKKLIGLLLIGLLHMPMACFHNGGTSCGSFYTSARFHALSSQIVTRDSDLVRPWSGFSIEPWDVLGIRLNPDSIEFLTRSTGFNFSLSSEVFACDPPLPEFPLIDDFVVLADSSFMINDELISPGDTVNHLFSFFNHWASAISEFVELQNMDTWVFGYDIDMVLELNQPPQDTIQSSFKIIVQLEDGAILETQSDLLKVSR